MRDRPDELSGTTTKIMTGYGNLYVTVNELDGVPFEVFCTIGKSGGGTTAKAEAIGRLVSMALRNGVPVEDVIGQLKGVGGDHPVPYRDTVIMSIPDAVGKVLEKLYCRREGNQA